MTRLLVVCALQAGMFPCVYVSKVHDGDTLTATIPGVPAVFGQEISVRLLGIDAPEISSDNPCEKAQAIKAKDLLTSLTLGKQVSLVDPQRDKYFRVLAHVRIGKIDASTKLLDAKLAVPYSGETKPIIDWCTYGATNP